MQKEHMTRRPRRMLVGAVALAMVSFTIAFVPGASAATCKVTFKDPQTGGEVTLECEGDQCSAGAKPNPPGIWCSASDDKGRSIST